MEGVNNELHQYTEDYPTITKENITQFLSKFSSIVTKFSPKGKRNHFKYRLLPFILKLIKVKRQLYRELKRNDDREIKAKFNKLNIAV